MNNPEILLANVTKLKTTELGVVRIKRNLNLEVIDVVEWCKEFVLNPESEITRTGKNWYVSLDGVTLTINASSYTIITAHKKKSTR
ncbi:DUF3781 domain-containing protein [Erysipelothrix urinaevulpis]|uniref:DUF3781 domain-containing protein n=1 Tax=Erysipelothrix urinaevulpis TaxID=2683717 RepID=UPI00135B20E8|nr:DUF3781 domain-containing protein [Erysipelothrix urinaevulpis]